MKKILVMLLIGLITTTLLSKPEYAITGGLNRGFIIYNDEYNNNANRVAMKSGIMLGSEVQIGSIIIGSSFVQRGASYKAGALDYIGSYTFNYISGYLFGKLTYMEVLSGFGGFQLGKWISGKQDGTVDDNFVSDALLENTFNLDFGLILGTDIMYSRSIGFRVSYYIGISDVLNGISSIYNFKNRGIGVCVLYKI